jgi:hypothetical protein
MTKDDFFEKCLDIISTEGYPKAGISYIKLNQVKKDFKRKYFSRIKPI